MGSCTRSSASSATRPCPNTRPGPKPPLIRLSPSHLSRILRRLDLPLKKSLIAAERDEAARVAWREQMAAVDPTDLVLLDETSTPLSLTPLRARAPRGQRAVGRVPRGKRPTSPGWPP